MKCIFRNFVDIPLWRLITTAVLLLGISLDSYSFFANQSLQPSFQEMMISTLNMYASYYIFLLLIVDLGFKYKGSEKKDEKFNSFSQNLVTIAFLFFIYLSFLTVCNIFVLLVKEGSISLSDRLNNVQLFGLEWMPASLAMGLDVLLFCLYFIFIGAVVYTINSHCRKRPYGYTGVLVLCILGVIKYNFDSIPIGILPSDYASVESALQITSNTRLNIAISVLYWFVLISVTGLIYHVINKSESKKRELRI